MLETNKPKCEVDADGNKHWLVNGKPHRTDGPAVEWANGGTSWYLNGQLHREDGPAIEYTDGTKKYYLHGEKVTEADLPMNK